MRRNFFDDWWEPKAMSTQEIALLGQSWRWILAAGIIYVLLGAVAFSLPMASTLGLTFGLAALLLIGGLTHLIHAIKLRRRRGGGARFFQSFVAIVAGGLMLRYPGGGMVGLALALSFYFFISAAAQWILFTSIRPHPGWGWGVAECW